MVTFNYDLTGIFPLSPRTNGKQNSKLVLAGDSEGTGSLSIKVSPSKA